MLYWSSGASIAAVVLLFQAYPDKGCSLETIRAAGGTIVPDQTTDGKGMHPLSLPFETSRLWFAGREVLETLYSTWIRRLELVNLRRYDVDNDRGTIMVRQGKGKKDRMVPIGERALYGNPSPIRAHLLVENGPTPGNK